MAKQRKKKSGKTRANGSGTVWTDPKTGNIYAVVSWSETIDGKKCRPRRARLARNKTHAYELIPGLLKDAARERLARAVHHGNQVARQEDTDDTDQDQEAGPDKPVNPARLTVGELARRYIRNRLQPVKRNSKHVKKSGLNSWRSAQDNVRLLVKYFGAGKLVRSITLANVRTFKTDRLNTPKQNGYWKEGVKVIEVRLDPATGKPMERSVRSVHIEIAALRAMLNYAVEEEWLEVNPIAGKKDLINSSEETMRERIAKPFEEGKLLEQCDDHFRRRHLKPYLIALFDTGCRSIELRRLLVQDVNFEKNYIEVFSDKTKVRSFRKVGMTPRLREQLVECCQDKKPSDHVFTYGKEKKPMKYPPKTAFNTAKRLAKFWSDDRVDLSDFRPHDARHTFITRAIENGVDVFTIGKVTGHEQPKTLYRYLNPNDDTVQRVADVIANVHAANVVHFPTQSKQKRSKTG